jgi:phage shock protein C
MASNRSIFHPDDKRGLEPRLWRSRTNKVFAGVAGGLAEKLDVNATMLRWFWAFATVFTGFMPGALIYLVLWAITGVRDTGPTGR